MSTIKVKIIQKGSKPDSATETPIRWGNCEFWKSSDLKDYDWAIVYDEFPRNTTGSISNETEPLACHPDQTLLVTVEPPSIKIYSSPYTGQFGTVITTHPVALMKHRDQIHTGGGLHWCYGKTLDKVLAQTEFPKTKILSTICSAKQQTHTLHADRYRLTKYVSEHIPELEWYGYGVRPLDNKYEAMDDYKYHIAIENYIGPHHWTEKLADSFLALCLPFYVGDKTVLEYFPEESIIFLPLDNLEEAAKIIRDAIDNGEYEKRLPALMEARKRILEKYNFWNLSSKAIEKRHQGKSPLPGKKLKGRHTLRKNPFNALKEFWQMLKYKISR